MNVLEVVNNEAGKASDFFECPNCYFTSTWENGALHCTCGRSTVRLNNVMVAQILKVPKMMKCSNTIVSKEDPDIR